MRHSMSVLFFGPFHLRTMATNSDIPATAMGIAETVFEVKRGRPFETAVTEFVRVLRTVPDGPPGETSTGTIQVLQHLAERVIRRIEERLARGEDRQPLQQRLAESVYDIRRALEELDRWQQHYRRPLSPLRNVSR